MRTTVIGIILLLPILILAGCKSPEVQGTNNPSKTPAYSNSPLTPKLILNAGSPIIAMRADRAGSVYALTVAGDLLQKTASSSQVKTLYKGLQRCGFSSRVLAVLPSGDAVVNDCDNNQDVIEQIGNDGKPKVIGRLEDSVTSLAVGPDGRIYVGLWKTEGNISIGEQLQGADNMWGEVVALNPQGKPENMWKGGILLSMDIPKKDTIQATVWGSAGNYTPSGEFSMCGPKNQFWIGLSGAAAIGLLGLGTTSLVQTESLSGMVYVTSANPDWILTFGGGSMGCGIYRIKPGTPAVKIRFVDDTVVHQLTDMTVSGDLFYFSDANGAVYSVPLDAMLKSPFPSVKDNQQKAADLKPVPSH